MKLNLGCGGAYKKDYLNIDSFNTTVADKKMSAVDLEIEDNIIKKIECSQLIEHIGLPGSIYVLSECFRVLKPGGILTIETPDINSSFKKYINGNRETRKNILPWIYGLETPGMQHKFCFPDDLLQEIIEKIGFINVKKKFFELDEYEPVLQVNCIKPKTYGVPQFISIYRKRLIQKKLIDLQNQFVALEQENVIDFFASKIRSLEKIWSKKILNEIMTKGAVYSPEMTYIFLETILEKKIIPKIKIRDYFNVLKKLDELDFTSILCYCFREMPNFVGEQKKLVATISNLGEKTVRNLLALNKRQSTLKSLTQTKKKLKPYDKITLFSEKILLNKANRLFQRGVKEFILANYNESIDNFKLSLSFYRNQILTYWNLGRLFSLINNMTQSKEYYVKTLDLSSRIEHQSKDMIKEKLNREINKRFIEKHINPLISLENIIAN